MTLSFAAERIETWPLARLRPYARNAKEHGADQVAKIAASMAGFGWTVPCLVADDGELIAGHGRVLAFDPDGDDKDGGAGGSVPPRNPASRAGDLWLLGDHRLLCGDATRHGDVRRLMNGERAVLFATDPPYLVDDDSNHSTRNKDWSASQRLKPHPKRVWQRC